MLGRICEGQMLRMKVRKMNRRDIRCLGFATHPGAMSTKEHIRRPGKERAPRRPSTHLPQLLARDDLLLLGWVEFNGITREQYERTFVPFTTLTLVVLTDTTDGMASSPSRGTFEFWVVRIVSRYEPEERERWPAAEVVVGSAASRVWDKSTRLWIQVDVIEGQPRSRVGI